MYAYIDETGDAGFQFDKNSSTYFVTGIVTHADQEVVNELAAIVRMKLRWRPDHEFKFSAVDDAAKALYLSTVRRARFKVHAMIFDKRRLAANARHDFYGELVGLSIEDVVEVIRGTHLVLDESFRGESKKRAFRTELRSRLARAEGRTAIKNLTYESSRSSDMLQLADMVVGAIGRTYRRGDNRYQSMIQKRIVAVREYP